MTETLLPSAVRMPRDGSYPPRVHDLLCRVLYEEADRLAQHGWNTLAHELTLSSAIRSTLWSLHRQGVVLNRAPDAALLADAKRRLYARWRADAAKHSSRERERWGMAALPLSALLPCQEPVAPAVAPSDDPLEPVALWLARHGKVSPMRVWAYLLRRYGEKKWNVVLAELALRFPDEPLPSCAALRTWAIAHFPRLDRLLQTEGRIWGDLPAFLKKLGQKLTHIVQTVRYCFENHSNGNPRVSA